MPRGPYRQYLQDINIPIPATTLRRRLQNVQNADALQNDAERYDGLAISESDDEYSPMELADDSAVVGIQDNQDFPSTSSADNNLSDSLPSLSSDAETQHFSDAASNNSNENSIHTDSSDSDCEYQDSICEENIYVDEQNEPNLERLTLYEGCQLTLEESKLLIMSFALRFDLSDKAFEHLIQLIDCHLPTNRHGSLFLFLKDLPEPPIVNTHFYCHVNKCKRLIKFAQNNVMECECGAVCTKANLKQAGCYFLYIPLKEQLIKLLNNNFIRKQLRWTDENHKDVINGAVYKKLLENGTISRGDITLQWNTDGVQLHKSSQIELWPIQVCINELPFRIRKDNVLLCGLWYGPGKPNMNTFLQPFVEELNILHTEGIEVFTANPVTIRVHTLLSSVDSMARPLLQNIKTFRGNQGCAFCLHSGEEYSVGRGRTRLYRGDIGIKRNLQQHRNDTLQVMRNGRVLNGIKGPSVLLLLKEFNIIKYFVPEYMHSVLLGVVKTMVSWWMDGKNKDRSFYIGNDTKIKEIDTLLLSIKPPSEITRTPRSLFDRKLWKASEWKNFLLYYSFICLQSVNMPKKYLDHWFLLVYSINIFLQEQFSEIEFIKATKALRKFVLSIENIYGTPELMKYNFHLLLHIPKSVKNFGGLWAMSAFPYEHYNGVLSKMFRNSHSVPLQICKNYLRMQSLQEMASNEFQNNNCSDIARNLFKKLFIQKSLRHCLKYGDSTRLLGIPDMYTLTLREKTVVEALVGEEILNLNIRTFKRFIHNNILYHVKGYERMIKRSNNIVQLQDKEFLSLTHIMIVNTALSNKQLCVLLGLKLHCTGESLSRDIETGLTSNLIFSIVEQTDSCVAIVPEMLFKKCVITPHPNDRRKFCCFPLVNSLETD